MSTIGQTSEFAVANMVGVWSSLTSEVIGETNMAAALMMERIAEASPRPRARIIGAVYLLYFLTAIFGMFFLKGLVVVGDAAATANNILAH